jgi:mannose-6-phosphate isomerase-like protein (cupin superfamily)
MENSMKPYVLLAGEGVAGFDASVKASRSSTGGNLTVIESRTRGGAPWHVHSREDEYFYVIEGKIIVHCGDENYSAGSGSFVFLPRGIPHAWDVGAEGVATLLMMTVPAMLEEFLKEFHSASTREDRDAVAARYGIQFFWERS